MNKILSLVFATLCVTSVTHGTDFLTLASYINRMPLKDCKLNDKVPLDEFRKYYPVKGPYKGQKKTSDGKAIPFEKIDNTLYKKHANCVCFLTNENRIHAWIKAIHEIIYLKYGENEQYNVIWRDHVDDSGLISRTEFLLSDNIGEDKFKYKVFIYMTTGNIMIQGNSYLEFCEEEFMHCLSKVTEVLDNECADKQVSALQINSDSDITSCKQITDQQARAHQINSDLEATSCKQIVEIDGDLDEPLADSPCRIADNNRPEIVKQGDLSKYVVMSEDVICMRFDKSEEMVSNLTDKFSEFMAERTNRDENQAISVNKRIDTIEDTVLNLSNAVSKFIETLAASKPSHASESQCERLQLKVDKLESEKAKHIEDSNKQKEAWSKKLKDIELKFNASQYENASTSEQLTELRKRVSDLSSKLVKTENLVEHKSSIIFDLEDKIDVLRSQVCELEAENKVLSSKIEDRESRSLSPVTQTQPPEVNNIGLLLLHDSICKYIDLSLFTYASDVAGKERKIRCSTINSVIETVRDMREQCDRVIVHVGINDLRNSVDSVSQVFEKYKVMVSEISKKSSRVILSLLVPCNEQPLSSNIMAFNSLILSEFSKFESIRICMNDNFSKQGSKIDFLFEDDIHLNKQGTKVLCSNLKKTVFGSLKSRNRDNSGRNPNTSRDNSLVRNPNTHRHSAGRPFNRGRGQYRQGNRDVANTLAQALLGALSK